MVWAEAAHTGEGLPQSHNKVTNTDHCLPASPLFSKGSQMKQGRWGKGGLQQQLLQSWGRQGPSSPPGVGVGSGGVCQQGLGARVGKFKAKVPVGGEGGCGESRGSQAGLGGGHLPLPEEHVQNNQKYKYQYHTSPTPPIICPTIIQ